MKNILSILELLIIIKIRPGMYFGDKITINNLIIFISGYSLGLGNGNDCLKNNEFYKFQEYIIEKTIGMENRTNECRKYLDCLLKVCNNDEEKARDLFYKLLDEFVEKEGIEIDPNLRQYMGNDKEED